VELATTVCLPDQPRSGKQPIVLFAFPGGGYFRHYFDLDLSHLPGCEGASYSQADHHLASGIIVVTCDATQAAHGCFDAIAVLAHGAHGSVAVRPEDFDGLSADAGATLYLSVCPSDPARI